jgi:hypothetical protein
LGAETTAARDASEAQIKCKVLSYEDFSASFELVVA